MEGIRSHLCLSIYIYIYVTHWMGSSDFLVLPPPPTSPRRLNPFDRHADRQTDGQSLLFRSSEGLSWYVLSCFCFKKLAK